MKYKTVMKYLRKRVDISESSCVKSNDIYKFLEPPKNNNTEKRVKYLVINSNSCYFKKKENVCI